MNKCRILTLLLSWSCSNEVPHGNQGNHGALSFGGTAGDLIGVTAPRGAERQRRPGTEHARSDNSLGDLLRYR